MILNIESEAKWLVETWRYETKQTLDKTRAVEALSAFNGDWLNREMLLRYMRVTVARDEVDPESWFRYFRGCLRQQHRKLSPSMGTYQASGVSADSEIAGLREDLRRERKARKRNERDALQYSHLLALVAEFFVSQEEILENRDDESCPQCKERFGSIDKVHVLLTQISAPEWALICASCISLNTNDDPRSD